MRRLIFLLLVAIPFSADAQKKFKTENVVLLTFDGFRWQEVFTGAEKRLIGKPFVGDSAGIVRDFWAESPEERRKKLLPFFWNVIGTKGVLAGNRTAGSKVNVTNKQWFSYPGYNEILCGFADDERIHSNDKFENPNTTVLEMIHKQPGYAGKVIAYSSWDVFPYIINAKRSGINVNAGLVKEFPGNANEKLLNEIMDEVPNPLGEVRLDAFTFHYAFEAFKRTKPKLTFISFDETDDFAHAGKYDAYLRSAHATDGFIQKLWNYCQSQPTYKDKTTFIITVDHGRGTEGREDWKHHGIKVQHADEIWMAIIGPDTPATGEQKTDSQYYQSQVAQTIATLLRVTYQSGKPSGKPLEQFIVK